MYSIIDGKVIIKGKDGNKKSSYKMIRYTETPVGPEAWISFKLVKYNHYSDGKKDDWNSYLVEVNICGDNSDTMISSCMNIDLITFDEAEAVNKFETMLTTLVENVKEG